MAGEEKVTDHEAMTKIRGYINTDDNAVAVGAIQARFEGVTDERITQLEAQNKELEESAKKVEERNDLYDNMLRDEIAKVLFIDRTNYDACSEEQKSQIEQLFEVAHANMEASLQVAS